MKRHTFLTLSTGLILSSIISSCKDEPAPKSERERAQDELYSLNIEAAAYDEQLIMAAQKGSLKRMELLLTAGADANATDMYGYSVLMLAIKSRNPIVVELLLTCYLDILQIMTKSIFKILSKKGLILIT